MLEKNQEFTEFIDEWTNQLIRSEALIEELSNKVTGIFKKKTKLEVDGDERAYIDGFFIIQDYYKDHVLSHFDYQAVSLYMSILYRCGVSSKWFFTNNFIETYTWLWYEITEVGHLFIQWDLSVEKARYRITLIQQNCQRFLESEYKKASTFDQKSSIKALVSLLPYSTKRIKHLFALDQKKR